MPQNKLTTFIHNNLIVTIIAALVVGGGLSALGFSAYNSGVKSVQSNITATTELPQSSSSTIKSSLISSSIVSSSVISSSSSEEVKKEVVKEPVKEAPKTVEVEKPKVVSTLVENPINKTDSKARTGYEEMPLISDWSDNGSSISPKFGLNWSRYESGTSNQACSNPVENGYNFINEFKNEENEFDFDLHTYVIKNISSAQSDVKHFENIDKFLDYGLIDVFTVGQAFPFSCSGFYITKIKDLDFKIKNVDNSRAMLTKQLDGYRLDVFGKKSGLYFYLNSDIRLSPEYMQSFDRACINGQSIDYQCSNKILFSDENIKLAEAKARKIMLAFENNFDY